ncbi:MAG: DUF3313 domain-containing protein [bacterium]|nr:DUF3313 domain-containing protein [bacterium]
MSKRTPTVLLLLLLGLSMATACATGEPGGAPSQESPPPVSSPPPAERIGDLVKVDIEADGELFIREDHRIGGFDAVYFPLATIEYASGSPTLNERTENEFLGLLEQSLVDNAESGGIEVADRAGRCVIRLQIAIEDLEIARRRRTGGTGDWASLTFAMELSDSRTGEPLARYAKPERIMSPGTGENRTELILANYAAILENIDLPAIVTGVTAEPSPPRDDCEGALAGLRPDARP